VDDWELVAAARLELADLGESLTAEQWNAPTLCEQWRVRHVFAHVIITALGPVGSPLLALMRDGLSPNDALARSAIDKGDGIDGDALVSELRDVASIRESPPGLEPAGFIADVIVHTQDICRPLRLPRQYGAEPVRRALDATPRAPTLHGIQARIEGLRLLATDVDWSYGDGAEVRAPGEALLMTMWGRDVGLEATNGPGATIVASRLAG
jgi:uncharacterized protein (TIGR03083 family)